MTRLPGLCRIDLLRHGEVTGGDRFRGSQDDPLTPAGWRQMRDAVNGRSEWDLIVTSPLLRCREFAAELAETVGVPCRIEPALREYHFGDWEGQTFADLHQRSPAALDAFFREPHRSTPPSGEPWAEFESRVLGAFRTLAKLDEYARVLVVTHGGVIRLLRCVLNGWPHTRMAEFSVPHASLHGLEKQADGQWQVAR